MNAEGPKHLYNVNPSLIQQEIASRSDNDSDVEEDELANENIIDREKTDESELDSIELAKRRNVIAEREDEYHARRRLRTLSPERADPFAKVDLVQRNYATVFAESKLIREQAAIVRSLRSAYHQQEINKEEPPVVTSSRFWAMDGEETPDTEKSSEWERLESTSTSFTPSGSSKLTRWDATPTLSEGMAATPIKAYGEATVRGYHTNAMLMTPDRSATSSKLNETGALLAARNAYLSDEELDLILPEYGYVIVDHKDIGISSTSVSENHVPATELCPYLGLTTGPFPQAETISSLPALKPDDIQHFSPLLALDNLRSEEDLSFAEIRELKLLRLLLKLKNGTPSQRRIALRQISERSREFGPALLFDKILPLLMTTSLEDQERHMLIKAIDRIIFRIGEAVRPFVHKILVVVEPLLVDEAYMTRIEGRQVIGNLAKAAGLATMIGAMRPDVDHPDEYVRNTTARALAVVAAALGIGTMLPFISAVTASKKGGWEARHTGVRTIHQIALLSSVAILPHLRALVSPLAPFLNFIDESTSSRDESTSFVDKKKDDYTHPRLRIAAAQAVGALAEACAPHGIEAFEETGIISRLWELARRVRGRTLAAVLRASGTLIPLMVASDPASAAFYARDLLSSVVIREFSSPDDDIRRAVLSFVRRASASTLRDERLDAFLTQRVITPFMDCFWTRRVALDRRLSLDVIETALALLAAGAHEAAGMMIPRVILSLRDDSESFRRMALIMIERTVRSEGILTLLAGDYETRKEKAKTHTNRPVAILVDALLAAATATDGERPPNDPLLCSRVIGVVAVALGSRFAPHISALVSLLLWRLNNKNASVRQQAANIVQGVAPAFIICGEDAALGRIGIVLGEYLGEEFPDVLAAIIGALHSLFRELGVAKMQPSTKDLIPRLTPILKNRNEDVQLATIELLGALATTAAESASPREWMRICFELIETLHAHRRNIRRAAILAFGAIARAIGPQDVLSTLLANLRVQERQSRVSTTIAIAVVADNCAPFTVLPALMAEYRTPELNVQNGVLKALSFLFEYIDMASHDYLYAVVPLLADALMDRDCVHRQTSAAAIRHCALGVAGLGCEDALIDLLNYLWPNIFEQSPHVITAVMDALEGLRVGLGAATLFLYVAQGLFHAARRVRQASWRIHNMLLVHGQESLVPVYPDAGEALDAERYGRHYLHLVI